MATRAGVAAISLAAILLAGCVRVRTISATHPALPQPEDKPDEAAAYYLRKRVPPGEELPAGKYLDAIVHLNRMSIYSSRTRRFIDKGKRRTSREISPGQWESLGPGNVGGRTRALLIHPTEHDIMYAGAVAGGIWKTTDGGMSWTHIDDSLPNLSIGSMAMDPNNPSVIYAGTGEWFTNALRGNSVRGAGILKTLDAGASWALLPATKDNRQFHYVNKIVVSPNDSNRIYAATASGILASHDAGESWSLALDRQAPENGCQDLVIRTDQPSDYLIAACGTSSANGARPAIFRSLDAAGEGSWTAVHSPERMSRTSLALAPSNQNIVYALASSEEPGDFQRGLLALYRSSSGGDPDTWEVRVDNRNPDRLGTGLLSNTQAFHADTCGAGERRFVNQGGYDNVVAVDPLDPDRVWAGGIDLFRSDDGGRTWGIASYWWARQDPQYSHADHHVLVFHPAYDGGSNQILFNANDGGIYRTGNSRARVGRGERAACEAGSSEITWRALNNNYGVTQFYNGVPYPGGFGYIGGTQDNGTIRGTDAAGANAWNRVFGGDGGYVAIDPRNVNVIYVENTALSLRKSTDGGINFRDAMNGITEPGSNFGFIAPFVLDPSNPDRLWIGGKSLWRSDDGASSWSQASGTFPDQVTAIAVSASDSNRVLVGVADGGVYRTGNAAAADRNTEWIRSQPRSGFLSGITFDPTDPNIAYAAYSEFKRSAEQSHIYKTLDGGATWNSIDGSGETGIPDIPIHVIAVNPEDPQSIYAGSDLGIFVSLDGGGTWSREETGFPNTVTQAIEVEKGRGVPYLYAFTHGRGAWRVRLGNGAGCSYNVPESITLPAIGRGANARIETGDECVWSIIPEANWLIVNSANGKGSGSLGIEAFANFGSAPRSTSAIVADKVVRIEQEAALSGNDEPAAAAVVGTLPYFALQDTTGVTVSELDPVHSCTGSRDAKTVWYRFRPPANGRYRAEAVMRRVENRDEDLGLVLTVYPAAAPTQELFCGQRASGGVGVEFDAREGADFLFQISGLGENNPGGLLLFIVTSR